MSRDKINVTTKDLNVLNTRMTGDIYVNINLGYIFSVLIIILNLNNYHDNHNTSYESQDLSKNQVE